VLERWVAETGPSLATASQLNADGMPMLISASDRGEADAGVERALWRLSTDLAPEMVSAAGARHLTVTYGPQAVLIGDAHAIWYAASGLESGAETRLWSALVVRGGRAVDITMNVQPALEETYLPILWTVLGTWVWLR
jgi:hypothetical protein